MNQDKPTARSPAPSNTPRPKDDGPLDSIGKAIADPVESAAEDEEPRENGKGKPLPPRSTPGG